MTLERENKQNIVFCLSFGWQMVGWPISARICAQPAVLHESTNLILFFQPLPPLQVAQWRRNYLRGVESKDKARGTVLGHYEKIRQCMFEFRGNE